jgi:RNA polymerase sigma factor (sigma-70 family)
MIERLEDLQLMKLIAENQPYALEQLYDRYEKAMYSFAYRILSDVMMAEQVVQELFMRVWNYAERFDSSHGELSTWMFTLTRNIAIDLLPQKQNRTAQQVAEQQQLNAIPDSRKAEERAESDWVSAQIKQALEFLSDEQKLLVDWIYYQGLTQQEVAAQYAIPLETVKTRVRLVMQQLKQRLEIVAERGMTHE